MQHMEYREGCAMLRKAGFTELEIERLSKLRMAHREEELYPKLEIQPSPPYRNWFERAMRKLTWLCWHLAYSGSIFWPYDHTAS